MRYRFLKSIVKNFVHKTKDLLKKTTGDLSYYLIENLNTDSKHFGLWSKHKQTTIYAKYLFTKTKTFTLVGIIGGKCKSSCYCIMFKFGDLNF